MNKENEKITLMTMIQLIGLVKCSRCDVSLDPIGSCLDSLGMKRAGMTIPVSKLLGIKPIQVYNRHCPLHLHRFLPLFGTINDL